MAEKQILDLLSNSTKQSYTRYVGAYNTFRKEQAHSECLLLAFLTHESESKAPTTLWTMYSLLKKYFLLECSFELGTAPRICDYLKTLSRHHKKAKAPPFSRDDLFKYLRTAPSDGAHLVDKLIMLCGFYGGLRSCELTALKWEDVTLSQEGVLINIAFSKTDRAGIGALKLLPKLEEEAICPVHYFNKYKQDS
jgi:integrase